MKANFILLAAILLSCNQEKEKPAAETTPAKKDLPAAEIQIKSALLAAPAEKRDSCTVLGYNADKQLVVLKQGTNELICLADNPDEPGIDVACYVKDLEPFMARGRELRRQGIKGDSLFNEREKEVKEGTLPMPKQPAALFVLTAKDEDFNAATGEVKNSYLRSVVYIPYATATSTGLPEKPAAQGMPWIMFPGTHAAHIMINP